MRLPAAPLDCVDADGQPRLGQFAGLAGGFGWHRLAAPFARGALWRRLHHKRWHFVALATDELYCATAVVDVGWGTSCFGYAFDRARGRELVSFSLLGAAGLSARVGESALAPSRFRWPGAEVAITHESGSWSMRLHARGLRIEASYGGPGETLLAVGSAQGGVVHATQKSSALALSGFAQVRGQRFGLCGGSASFDYSNGLLGRRTAWRWVSAHGPGVGINLQQGYFGDAENALWLDGKLFPLSSMSIEPDTNSGGLRVRTSDGLVDLCFTPEGARRDNKQLVVASSRLQQQIGVFNGWVKASRGAAPLSVRNLVGIVEQHSARW